MHRVLLLPLVFGASCGSPHPVVDAGGGSSSDDAARQTDASSLDAATDTPQGLPFPYLRPDVGTPLTAAELSAITTEYIDLLTQTRYLDVLDERVHGWPESDPQHRFWFGTWWNGLGVFREGGNVTYRHVTGTDNPGIDTSYIMESVCAAAKMWPSPKLEHLAHRLIRGMHAWILGMERMPNDPITGLLARTVYPPSHMSTDGGRNVYVDYDANRPGGDSYTQYVYLPENPTWGDIYIKNNRSKDDLGHMMRALAGMQDCAGGFTAETLADLQATRDAYATWAARVEDDGWAIATWDTSVHLRIPGITETGARFYMIGNAECDGAASLQRVARGSTSFDCGNGIHPLEPIVLLGHSNGEIIRSFHESLTRLALLNGDNTSALSLLQGLGTRLDEGMEAVSTGNWPSGLNPTNLVRLMVNSVVTGVPLTSQEVRWLHGQIHLAHDAYLALGPDVYRVFDPATPDGVYSFAPSVEGVNIPFVILGALAGSCSAKNLNPTTRPVFDCAQLENAGF